MGYLHVTLLSECIIGNNEREISILHEDAVCGIENLEFFVSEREQENPGKSRTMSALTFLLFKLNTLQTKN